MMTEGGCPDAAGIGNPLKIELRGASQRVADEAPVNKISRVVNRDTRKPLEAAIGDIIVFPNPDDAGIWIKSRKNGIGDVHSVQKFGIALSITLPSVKSQPMESASSLLGELRVHQLRE